MNEAGAIPKINFRDHLKDWRFWIVLLLASQFALFQLIWPIAYGDAPRNLHWGIYLTEQPRFLLDAEDVYDRTYGYPPEDPSLAPMSLTRDQGTWFHPWWGPLYPLIVAFLWKLSASYTLLQLFSPVCAGIVILMTYLFGASYFNRRIGFTAALLLAITPVFREHVILAFTEPLGALFLFATFWSDLRRNDLLTVVLGSLCMLLKIDLIFLYFGTLILIEFAQWRERRGGFDLRHAIMSIGIPGLVASAWLILNYGISNRPTTVMGAPNIDVLIGLAPLVIEQFLTTIPLFTYLTLGLMIFCIWLALWKRGLADKKIYRLLGVWSGLGIFVLIVYMSFPGAANNPRILIPTFPALFLLISTGINELKMRPRMLVESYLIVILAIMSAVGGLYQVILSEEHQSTLPVWDTLRNEPKGYVLTEYFWHANLYARQPSTWFFTDAIYEHNIMHNLEYFQPYLEEHPIRYVVLPLHDDPKRQYDSKYVQIYQAIGLGRKLGLRSEPVASPDVRTYLERTYPQEVIGDFVIFKIW